MKSEKFVCDICGTQVKEEHAVLLLKFHPQNGLAQQVTVDLCAEHAQPTWQKLKETFGQ